jgi:site-specific DNA-adenine methylase
MKVRCTNVDFEAMINDQSPALLYLDPPYFKYGGDLYRHNFSDADHKRLAGALRKTRNPWVLSYDDCDEARKLYSWAAISEPVSVTYQITRNITTKKELLISSPLHENRLLKAS